MDNIAQAQAMFLRQLTLLSRFTMPNAKRFAVLEALRDPLRQAQEAAAKKFAARPLPLTPSEKAALDSTLAIWSALLTNYLHCFEGEGSNGQSKKRAATIAQRALATLADWQVDLVRSERLPDAGYWQKLNSIFARAESSGFAVQPVNDSLRHGKVSVSPLSAYAECQLLHAASPYELSSRDLLWVARWSRRWGAKIGLLHKPPQDIHRCAHPLWVDLDSDQPVGYLPKPATHGRWLDTTALRTSLASRIELLAQDQSPAVLQLGRDVVQPAAEKLLTRLLQRWCYGGVKRRHERSSASGACRLIVGFDAVHFHLSGQRAFKRSTDSSLSQERSLTFSPESNGSNIEKWEIMDDWRLLNTSDSGLRITRSIKDGARMGAGSLVAIQPKQDADFTLGCVRWVLRQDANTLSAGILLFSGEVLAVAVRFGYDRPISYPGFLIPANDIAGEPASIILPVGSFQPGRRIEIMRQTAELVTLTHQVNCDGEFERCAYER